METKQQKLRSSSPCVLVEQDFCCFLNTVVEHTVENTCLFLSPYIFYPQKNPNRVANLTEQNQTFSGPWFIVHRIIKTQRKKQADCLLFTSGLRHTGLSCLLAHFSTSASFFQEPVTFLFLLSSMRQTHLLKTEGLTSVILTHTECKQACI